MIVSSRFEAVAGARPRVGYGPAEAPWAMESSDGSFRLTDIVPGLLFFLAMALFAPRLSVPADYEFDEVYHAYTAGQYVAGNADAYLWNKTAPREGVAYMWNHPPAGLLCIASGILIWGDNAFGWRFASAMFGAAGIVLVYRLSLRLTSDRRVAILAAVLTLCDGMYFMQSRVAMLDVFGTVFALAALASLYEVLTAEDARLAAPIVRTGIFLGLALATKWNAAYLCACCGIAVVVRVVLALRRTRAAGLRAAGAAVAGLGIVPFAIYLLAYVPFFVSGHSWGQWIEVQRQIFLYHTRLTATHPWSSKWWEWPLALKPVWYWTAADRGLVANGYAAPNPILYWAFLPAVAALAIRWRRNLPALTVLLIGFFGQWLPWALVPRIAFAYHFLPAVPFGALAVASAVIAMHARAGLTRVAAWAYVAAVVAAFVFYYPILVGLPLTPAALGWRLWLPGWRPV
jgi:dolichyl-phosphate-mannose--protein O-mannosyl transferase